MKTKSDFVNFLNLIFKLGKRRVLIETGLLFLNEFLRFKFLNNIFLFKSSQKLSKNGYNNTSIKYLKKFKLNNQVKVNLKEDKLVKVNI